jgi:hypothetical protein
MLGVLKDIAGLMSYADDRKGDGKTLDSVAFLVKELIDPIEDFLSWCEIYASVPTGQEKPDAAPEATP